MTIDPKLKPLFANLKRLKIGEYLYTKEFKLYTIQENFDDFWVYCNKVVSNERNVVVIGFHDTEDDEKAFAYLMSEWYNKRYSTFAEFITTILLNFAKWHPTKLDFFSIHHNFKQIGLTDENLLAFTKESRKIRDSKPEKREENNLDKKKTTKKKFDNKKVFIVHGHDNKTKIEIARTVEKLDLTPIILHEQANEGKTIIEKFEFHSDVGFAIILMTGDDLGRVKTSDDDKYRARQNVILEMGYFLGRLGRKGVFPLYEKNVELPSDLYGLLYTLIDDAGSWKFALVKELQAAGYGVDANHIL